MTEKKINVITEEQKGEHPWILRRGALEIQALMPEVSINGDYADLNYCINYAHWKESHGVMVGHYTHLEEKGHWRKVFLETIERFDWYTVTCDRTARILEENGADPNKIVKIPYGCDERVRNDREGVVVFGVVGRTYPTGRKGEWMVKKMVEHNFCVFCWGQGWPCPEMIEGSPWDALPDFYQSIDYLVVTSLNEGGPVPVVDAIAAGVPVIAPDVGWCFEFPIIQYMRGSWESLHHVLDALVHPPTWKMWSELHRDLFSEIVKSIQLSRR